MRRLILVLLSCLLVAGYVAPGASAHPATGIIVGPRGDVYFSDLETIWRLDAAGRLTVFRARAGGHVHELSIDGAGNVYGADVSYEPATGRWLHALWRMTPEGGETFIVAPTSEFPRALSIWRDARGNNFFVEQDNHKKERTLLLRRTPDGRVETFAGGAYGHADGRGTRARFSGVGGLGLGRDGSVYLSDGGAVRRVSPEGDVTTLARGLDSKDLGRDAATKRQHGSLMGLAADDEGNVYVADHGNRRVLKVSAAGKVETFLTAEPPWSPTGVAVASGGVYVLEIGFTHPASYSGPRVRHVSHEGAVKTLGTVGPKERAAARVTVRESSDAGSQADTTAKQDDKSPAERTAERYEANAARFESGVAIYFGLGLLGILAFARLARTRGGV